MDFLLRLATKCLPCFPDLLQPGLTLNGTRYRIVRLLGEGGFSYVYLVSQRNNPAILYAVKKIRCPYGSSDATFGNAMREIASYHRFAAVQTPYIVHTIDEAVVSEPDGSRTFYVVLPYFERLLQDVINANVLGNTSMDEAEVLRVFVGVLRGVQAMHKYKGVGGNESDDASDAAAGDALLDSLDESALPTELLELCPYAHHDIKPANVMLLAEGLPVLVDLGSCSKARVTVHTRQQALALTDFAQEHCTLPYRAPELLDVATNAEISEKTDIWSLGCLLYACCYGFSPFEKLEIDQGANLNVAIAQGRYEIPETPEFSPELLDLVKSCLKLDPAERPSVDELLDSTLALLLS